MPEIVRLLQCLALAIATVVCAGITSPGQGIANLAAPVDVAAPDSASAVRWASPSEPLRQWRNRAAARPAGDLKAVAAESDDGDPRPELADDAASAFEAASFPREPARASRDEPRTDTSRFAISTGLPRGPPT